MEHSESKTAVLTDNEPPDGAKLVLEQGDGWRILVRDDADAKLWAFDAATEHWFDACDRGAGANTLHHWVSDGSTRAVYALGEKLAQF